MKVFYRIVIVVLLTGFVISGCGFNQVHRYSLQGETMGTVWNVTIEGTQEIDKELIGKVIENRLQEINLVFSTWIDDSEISRINTSKQNELKVSSEFGQLLKLAMDWNEATNGAFDITVKPLIDAYGFSGDEDKALPSKATINKHLKNIGSDKISYDGDLQLLVRQNLKVQLDFSAIAKGYAVTEISRILTELGLDSHLVEIGGEVQVGDVKPDGSAWLVAIEVPTTDLNRSAHKPISLVDMAIATSGDYRNYREVDGVRISHIVNPKTGETARHALASVSVIHPSCTIADILATAIYALGEDDGKKLADSLEVPIYMIIRQGEGFATRFNSFMQPYL